jgi:predicted membrane metal-binding protein
LTSLIEIVGWTAAGLILLAYALLTTERITVRSTAYQAMNLVGALGFVINSGYHGALPSAILNIVWMAIALWALWRLWRLA